MSTNFFTVDDIFLQRLKSAMDDARINKSNLAKKVGISPSFLTDVFKRRSMMSERTARQIAMALSVSVDWLLFGEGEIRLVKENQEVYNVTQEGKKLTPEENRLLQLLSDAPMARVAMETFLKLPPAKQAKRLKEMLGDLEEE